MSLIGQARLLLAPNGGDSAAALTADVLKLTAPLSFWGGFDPRTGTVIDTHHADVGARLAGRLLVLPASRGSAGTPGGLAEAVCLGTAPAAILTGHVDVNLLVGARAGVLLYGWAMAIGTLDDETYGRLESGVAVTLHADGRLESA